MSITPLTKEPSAFHSGDTINWLIALPDYPASGGWTLKYNAVSAAGRFALIAAASNDDHAVTADKSATAAYKAGAYSLTKYVENSTERVTLETLHITVLPNLAGTTTAMEVRSWAQRCLDAIEAVMEGRASRSDLEHELNIGGNSRRLKSMTSQELLTAHGAFTIKVWQERNPGKAAPQIRMEYSRGNGL